MNYDHLLVIIDLIKRIHKTHKTNSRQKELVVVKTISSLEMNVLELERELVEVEIQNRSLRKELSDREGTIV